jgi:uncharacterized protein YpuA (DUF1002 family)
MVISINADELKKLKQDRNIKKVGNRKNRTAVLPERVKEEAIRQFEETTSPHAREGDVEIDEHMKMNDTFMRTGKYHPKKK